MSNQQQDDWSKPFPERYLACANALAQLEHWLMVTGMSGNTHFKALQADFIAHGATTFRDINRENQA